MATLPHTCSGLGIAEVFGNAAWAYRGLPCAHGLFIMATLAQEEEDDSQDRQRQRGKTGWAFQKTRLESLFSTSL